MTTDRIERAARARYERVNGEGTWDEAAAGLKAEVIRIVEMVMEDVCPELMSDPPSHWVAPMEATEGMLGEAWKVPRKIFDEVPDYGALYRAMRDAHLKEQGK